MGKSTDTKDEIVVYGLQLTSAKQGMLANFSTMLSYEQNVANAEFCCDAFNVKEETGLTPRQLLEENKTLNGCLAHRDERLSKLVSENTQVREENKELKEQRDRFQKALELIEKAYDWQQDAAGKISHDILTEVLSTKQD